MQLEEFYDYKNKLMEDLLTSDSVVRLLSDSFDDINPLDLRYTQVFPYEYIPETVEHGKTFICCDVDIQKSLNKTFLMPTIFVWVFTHKSLLRIPGVGIRTDLLCSEISKILNGNRCYGLGELDLYSVKRFAPMTDYQGKVMMFQTKDWNRPSPTGHQTPSNRKLGV